MQTIGLGQNTQVEIISAYAATNQQLDAVAVAPAWAPIGGFYMPATARVQLELIGLVSDTDNVISVQLFDVAAAEYVSGSETLALSADVTSRSVSGAFELAGGRVYEMHAQVIGPSGFGIVRSAQLIQ